MRKYTARDWSCRVCGAPQPMMDHTGKSIFSVAGGRCPSCGAPTPVFAVPRWNELSFTGKLLLAAFGFAALLLAIAALARLSGLGI